MTPNWKNLFCVLLLALMGGPGLEAVDQTTRTANAWQVSFTGPDTVTVGIESKFTCVTSCAVNVECTIGWRLSGAIPSGSFSTKDSVATWTPSKPGPQSFTCTARNETTGQSAEATKTVEVKAATVIDSVTTTAPDPESGVAQLTGPLALILSLGVLMVLEI